jgi:hypothetical protein
MPRGKGGDAKPRGRMTAYAFFVQTCREEHKKKHPEESVVFAEFSKKCAERWKVSSPFCFVIFFSFVSFLLPFPAVFCSARGGWRELLRCSLERPPDRLISGAPSINFSRRRRAFRRLYLGPLELVFIACV